MEREITLYTAKVDHWKTDLDRLLKEGGTDFSAERLKRGRAFVKADDMYRCLLAELLLKKSLEEEYGSQVAELHVEYSEFGKPVLPGYSDCHVNLSHSGNLVLCVVDQHSVGVDVEKIREIDPGVAESCFTVNERRFLQSKPSEFLARFYQLWTLKESYLKALGTGLSRDPLTVELIPTGDKQWWQVKGDSLYRVQSIDLVEGYAAALCCSGLYAHARTVEYHTRRPLHSHD